jgi:chromosome partitioning protein
MEVLAVINQKGGVGKSTTVFAMGAGFILKGFRVMYIDLDAQGNLSYTLKTDNTSPNAMDFLTKQTPIEQVIQHTTQGDIIPSGSSLAGADLVITNSGKEYRLKEALNPLKDLYDYIIIDTPPALGILTINALTACTGAVIPAQADIYSLQGISQLYSTINAVQQHSNPNLKVNGILLTRHNPRAILSRDIADITAQTANKLQTKLFKTTIREAIAIKEAQAKQQDIYSYAPKSSVVEDYTAFVNELLGNSKISNGRGRNNGTKKEF